MKVISYDKEKKMFTLNTGHLAYAINGEVIVYGKKAILNSSGKGYKKVLDAIIKYIDEQK